MTEVTDGGRVGLDGRTLLNNAYARIWQEAQKSLKEQGPERSSGSFDPACPYTSLRSPMANSLRTNSGQSVQQASHVPFAGRADATESLMHAGQHRGLRLYRYRTTGYRSEVPA